MKRRTLSRMDFYLAIVLCMAMWVNLVHVSNMSRPIYVRELSIPVSKIDIARLTETDTENSGQENKIPPQTVAEVIDGLEETFLIASADLIDNESIKSADAIVTSLLQSMKIAQLNLDYAGNIILSDNEMDLVLEYQPIYEKAAIEVGIPWQILAALHYRENNFQLTNPDNGQGIYQIITSSYSAGGVSLDEFQQQTFAAAKFLKEICPELSIDSSDDVIKRALFRYNGAYDFYIQQALDLGYSQAEAENGEGSPYVMNRIDATRDAGTWQELISQGSVSASERYGAYVIYSALKGEV